VKLFLLIIVILSILGILEYTAIVPTTSFSVLVTLDAIATFIKSLQIHSYYLIVPDITITVQGLLSLFFILFVVGYISDRFINLENKIKSLNKDIKNLRAIKEEPKIVEPEANNEMQQIATEIRGFLETLAKSVTVNPSTPIRSKKIRRVSAEVSNDEIHQNETTANEEIEQDVVTDNNQSESNEINKGSSVTSDDNLSSIDLAKALIQSDEKDKAKEVLLDIIKNGSANDAHEARVLNLQIS
jgi:FimV-like protein